ncbi:DUF7734 family protein [Synechococcus elongatus]|uniref:DUF7734 domain-containing protein n=1 Tax=Synechococcus elongatus (strain ATCC 33912 / PCC 7942 / FACHB-805) TaxID=1140 RepID=Q31RC4_SYNE7|nr:hypothetical protein [Synechococcus elongatus]ABB56395.1 conserved hypothetical protein [Synechococcus elongatus PCC 7942 = FACHB-805]AJD56556.1 hypothetical protein M744_01180 [Synechococcus elongatus UTEX 2973]MBD2588230.1 hypothetical protein [Synechococcus elongatus FACHB-242]MBD2689298.1 hypothetical protein [Synechococcus elongatus FACHB-1061]MBD2707062.1 hypothetical protein [Synechococcus elongatus PCC 7942 = FACHB-805]
MTLPIHQLEQYSLRHRDWVLRVLAEDQGKAVELLVFRGFSSSLTQPTDFDPDVPVLPASATIQSVQRFRSPYNAEQPLAPPQTWADFAAALEAE